MLYNDMSYGTGKGWCTQHAQLYVYWANRAGIPTRFVFGARTQDNTIVYTGHAFAESWIKEQNRWAFVDLSHAQIYIADRKGRVLNTVELFQLNQLGAWDSTYSRVYMDWEWSARLNLPYADTVVTLPFTQCNAEVSSEFTPHSIFKYRRPPNVEDVREIYTGFYRDKTFLLGNLERYLFRPQLAYSFYPTEGKDTYRLRQGLFFGMIGSCVLWLVFRWRSRRKAV
jgi:transglutaminase-like putative cysteine protease